MKAEPLQRIGAALDFCAVRLDDERAIWHDMTPANETRGEPPVSDRYGRTALMQAAAQDNLETVLTLLSAHVDIHARDRMGNTALTWAALMGHTDVVQALLATART
jgi:ankyrin repeat protein